MSPAESDSVRKPSVTGELMETVWKRIKSEFSNKSSHVIMNYEGKSGGTKLIGRADVK